MSPGRNVLHIAQQDKFLPPFAKFLREQLPDSVERHRFWVAGSYDHAELADGMYPVGAGRYRNLARLLQRAQMIILHGLFDMNVVKLLLMWPRLLKRSYWVIWGGDLYQGVGGFPRIQTRLNEFARRALIRRVGHLVSYIKGDIARARNWYGATGEWHECLMYPSNLFKATSESIVEKADDLMTIQVGNSADPSNEHEEVFECLRPYREMNIRIMVPLSYGDSSYARQVVALGQNIFGEKFLPIVRLMSFDEYVRLLSTVTIGVFNHRRQQAMGNVITLLGFGKTVFMRSGTASWEELSSRNVSLKPIEELSLETLPTEDANRNAAIIKEQFSEAVLRRQLVDLFGG